MKSTVKFTPDRIRATRETLGLTQEQAGRLLGGGPRAFTKYETGSLRPSASTINLLRVLEVYPDALWVLRGGGPPEVRSRLPSPFEVSGAQLASLGAPTLASLLERVLVAEAGANDLPLDGIHVASNIHAPDGGEDGRISWREGPARTRWLPSRLCQFQLKARKVPLQSAAHDVLTPEGQVKEMVRSALEQGGHYIMLCSHRYTERTVASRRNAISDNLSKAGLPVPSDWVQFWEADKLAAWVNSHQSVALWLREQLGLGSAGGFTTWNHWKGRSEHSVPWVEDPRLANLCGTLRNKITEPGAVLRVTGLSGIGKSRLCLEALKKVGEDRNVDRPLRDFVMYAIQSEVGAEAIYPIVEKLSGSGGRAVVVVDDCDARAHEILAGIVSRPESRLSLISIDSENPSHTDAATVKIGEAPSTVIDRIVDNVAAALQDVDRLRLARLSQGFPEIAIQIARESDARRHLTYPVDDRFIDEFVCGRRSTDQTRLLQSAQLLAVFGPVRVEPTEEAQPASFRAVAPESSTEENLAKIADLGRHFTRDDLYAGIQQLARRGVIKRRGGLREIQPRPIAVRLAERQWQEWDERKWDWVLSGEIGPELSVSAARRLAELNAAEIANDVVVQVCRESGQLGRDEGIVLPGRAEVLSALAQINADAVAEHIGRSLDRLGDLRLLRDDGHRSIIRALRTIAFPSSTFMVGARLLLRLAVTGSAHTTSVASSPFFAELFSPFLGGTEADGDTRLLFLDEAADASDRVQLEHVVDALVAGSSVGGASWTVGPEIQGSRKALHPWNPNSEQELARYVAGCVNRLGRLGARGDDVGAKARSDLGLAISSLVCHGFIEPVEDAIRLTVGAGHSWSLALRQLKGVLEHHSDLIDDPTADRVRSLLNELEPTSLPDRVRVFVIEPPMPGSVERESSIAAQSKQHRAIVHALAEELLRESTILSDLLPELSRGRQAMAAELGESLAQSAPSPLEWLEPIVQAVVGLPAPKRNYDLLFGFVASLPVQFQDEGEAFRARAIGSPDLAPAFPKICRRAGLTQQDIARAIGALDQGTLVPWDLHHWAYAWVLDKVPPAAVALLLDSMLDHSAPSFVLAVTILGRILADEGETAETSRPDRYTLTDFRPQVLKMARNACRWSRTESNPPPSLAGSGIDLNVAQSYFEKVVSSMLAQGREDSDARATALALAQALANGDHRGWLDPRSGQPTAVLTRMLDGFPEIVWPLIGAAIVANRRFESRMRYVLGRPYKFGRDIRPPILDLPEETLFVWCHANPERAPAFVAKCVPILSTEGDDADDRLFHPVVRRLLEEFGERDDVCQAFESNIHTYGWFGSAATHYARLREPLEQLLNHPKPRVRQWAEKMRGQIARCIARETIRDEEREAQGAWFG